MRDLSLLTSTLRGLRDGVLRRLDMKQEPAHFQYDWCTLSDEEKSIACDLAPLRNRIFLKEFYRVPNLEGGITYFRRVEG